MTKMENKNYPLKKKYIYLKTWFKRWHVSRPHTYNKTKNSQTRTTLHPEPIPPHISEIPNKLTDVNNEKRENWSSDKRVSETTVEHKKMILDQLQEFQEKRRGENYAIKIRNIDVVETSKFKENELLVSHSLYPINAAVIVGDSVINGIQK